MLKLFKKKKNEIDIDKLIFEIVEHQKDEDFQMLYKLMKGREFYLPAVMESLPTRAEPGEKIVIKSTDQVMVKKVLGPNNLPYVSASTNVNHPLVKEGCVGIEGFELLEMVLKIEDVYGLLLQSATSYLAFDKQRISYILGKKIDTVTVPPGHKVVVFRPTPKTHVSRTKSGFWIVDFGYSEPELSLYNSIEQLVINAQNNVILIISSTLIERLDNPGNVINKLEKIYREKDNKSGMTLVVAFPREKDMELMRKVKNTGMPVFNSAHDGACFVEVHKPDGIVVGMPGKPV